MKVFQVNSTTHTLRIIPRYYADTVILKLRNELRDEFTTFQVQTTTDNGYMVIAFEFEFTEGNSHEITVLDTDNNLLYRGKSYATAQGDLQNYKLTK